jgi:hypothetical protein
MPVHLRQYLLSHYEDGLGGLLQSKGGVSDPSVAFIHIDDRGDNDSFTDFCNIFCTVISSKKIRLELTGKFPIIDGMVDLAEIYGGSVDRARGRLVMNLSVGQSAAVDELAQLIKQTARMGSLAGNPGWLRVSARTVSSLLRLGRVMREYVSEAGG